MKQLILMTGIVALLIASGAQAATFEKVQLDSRFEQSLKICHLEVDADSLDVAACPMVDQYDTIDGREVAVREFFDRERGFDLAPAAASEASKILLGSMEAQAQALQAPAAIRAMRNTMATLKDFLMSAEKGGARIYVDPRTYWWPSVNAVAAVVVEPTGRVTMIMHGDTDG